MAGLMNGYRERLKDALTQGRVDQDFYRVLDETCKLVNRELDKRTGSAATWYMATLYDEVRRHAGRGIDPYFADSLAHSLRQDLRLLNQSKQSK